MKCAFCKQEKQIFDMYYFGDNIYLCIIHPGVIEAWNKELDVIEAVKHNHEFDEGLEIQDMRTYN